MNIELIIAVDKKTGGIGYKNTIPWKNKADMKWFKTVTTGVGNNAVVMGRNTYMSIGKALPNRLNIVLTSQENLEFNGCEIAHSFEDAVKIAKAHKVDSLFVIGGSTLYQYVLINNLVDTMYIDLIKNNKKYKYDTFFNHPLIDYFIKNDPYDLHFDNDYDDYDDYDRFDCYNKICDEWSKVDDNIIYAAYRDIFAADHSCKPMIFHNLYHKHHSVNSYIDMCNRRQVRETHDEKYLELLKDILSEGETKHTRAGDTSSLFNRNLRFDLTEGLPILTTKKVYTKGCIHELLWMLHGDTNIKYLIDNNTHIWDDDAYRHYKELMNDNNMDVMSKEDFLKEVENQTSITVNKNGKEISYVYGDLGPVYGKQWRNCGGVDQIKELINKLKNNPDDRRLIVSAWNVAEIEDMALPPCHYLSQWYVSNNISIHERTEYYIKQYFLEHPEKKATMTEDEYDEFEESLTEEFLDAHNVPKKGLCCMWSQRSVDTCLGFPYDLLSYSILTHMIAQVCNYIPLEVSCNLGDVHVYKNQIDAARIQLIRSPYRYKYPEILLNKDIKDIDNFTYDDIKIIGYESYPPIKYQLSVGL